MSEQENGIGASRSSGRLSDFDLLQQEIRARRARAANSLDAVERLLRSSSFLASFLSKDLPVFTEADAASPTAQSGYSEEQSGYPPATDRSTSPSSRDVVAPVRESHEYALRLPADVTACREIAEKCAFIVGFARSSTTILAEIINTSPFAYLLAEAHFYLPHSALRFRDSYNQMHKEFGNQASKTTYAPDFVPARTHAWWEWLREASKHYSVVGDKIALHSYHFSLVSSDDIRSFLEARFFDSKYIFLIRDPIQTLLSVTKLFGIGPLENVRLIKEIDAWLTYVQLWADCVRILPSTLTIITDNLNKTNIVTVSKFLNIPLEKSEILISKSEKRLHRNARSYAELQKWQPELEAIFSQIKAATTSDAILWQADQKRTIAENDTRKDVSAPISLAPQPIGQAWVMAADLRERLRKL